MPKAKDVMDARDIESVAGLRQFCRDAFGTADVRIVLPDGTVASKAIASILTLSDGSEVFEMHIR